MPSGAYYNEHDANAAGWLRELIARGLIAPGDVDERSIVDVSASDLAGVEPGTFPLVTGAPARVVRLRGYGNALCGPQAQAFIEAYLDVTLSTMRNP